MTNVIEGNIHSRVASCNMRLLSILLAVILVCDQIANGYRILGVFTLNGKSHWMMTHQLMKGLARRGHQVDVITHFPQKKPIPNYTEISLAGSMSLMTNNLSMEEALQFRGVNLKHLTYMAGTMNCELLAHPKIRNLIENPPQDPPYDLVITEV